MEMRRPILCADNWYVLGVEEKLTPAYTVASWDEQDAEEYAELISGRSTEQVDSLNASADLIKSFLDTEEEMATGMTFQEDSAGEINIINADGAITKTLHFPKVFGFMTYHENESGGLYVFCGNNDEDDNDAWTREDYVPTISGIVIDAQYDNTYSINDPIYIGLVDYVRSLLTTGIETSELPFMKLEHIYMDRWGIYGKHGELITGVAYHTLEEAVSTVMRICDFCGFDTWYSFKNGESLSISSLSCTYNQSGTVYNTDPLDSLKDDLTVVATYSDNTTATLGNNNYVLDGTLKIGSSRITVICGGQQSTFRVTVTADENSATGVSCTFDEDASIVYSNDSLDSLRSYLRVTATYPEGSTNVINNYTLSGTLSPGDSTIAVTYGRQTTYFKVYVIAEGTIVRKYRLSNGTLLPLVAGGGTSIVGNGIIVINNYESGVRRIISVDSGVMPYNQRSGGSGTGTPSIHYPIPIMSTAVKARLTVRPENLYVGGVVYKYANNAYSAVTSWTSRASSLEINFSSDESLYLMGQVRRSNDTQITETIEEVTVTIMSAPVEVTSIACSFDQGARTIYESDSLDTLKQNLTVIAYNTNGNSDAVQSDKYALSGTLVAGTTSTVTVTYKGKTATFGVNVSPMIRNWNFRASLTDTIVGETLVPSAASGINPPSRSTNGLRFSAATQRLLLSEDYQPVDMTIEIDVAEFNFAGDSTKHVRFLMNTNSEDSNVVGSGSLIFRSGYGWSVYGYTDSISNAQGFRAWAENGWGSLYGTDKINAFAGKTVKMLFDSDGKTRALYLNNELVGMITNSYFNHHSSHIAIGGASTYSAASGDQCYNMTITGIRIYRGAV